MRLRNFHKRIKKANEIGTDINSATATITTATITTANVNTFTADVKLVVPTTAYTGANATYGSIYATGAYLYFSNGVSWISGAGGLG